MNFSSENKSRLTGADLELKLLAVGTGGQTAGEIVKLRTYEITIRCPDSWTGIGISEFFFGFYFIKIDL